MNDRPDLEARLSRFLVEDAPPRGPGTAHRCGADQRRGDAPGPTDGLARLASVSWILSPAGAVAAAVVIGMLGSALYLSGRNGPSIGSGPSTPPPSASPSASTSPFPCPSGQGTCLGLLQPGTHRSSSFVPAISYTVDGGWANTLDVRGQLDLSYATGGQYTYPDGLTFRDGISIFRQPVAESTASQTAQPGVGTTANDLAQWLVAHAGLRPPPQRR